MWPGPAPGSAHTATQKGVWVQSWTYPRRPEDLKSGSQWFEMSFDSRVSWKSRFLSAGSSTTT